MATEPGRAVLTGPGVKLNGAEDQAFRAVKERDHADLNGLWRAFESGL